MDALVLLGGEGTRMRPLTYDTPKPMLPIVERPMIARVVEWLARYGVEQVVFALAYRSDAFATAFPDGTWAGVTISFTIEPEPLDTAGAIRFAAMNAGFDDRPLIICNGDILTDLDLDHLIFYHRTHGAEATISVGPVDDPSAFGVVLTGDDGRVLGFIEKPPPGTSTSKFVNTGTYVFEPSVIAQIPDGRRVSLEREVFPDLVRNGSVYASRSPAYWLDTGTPHRYIKAQLDILRGINQLVEIPEAKEVHQGIYVASDARIDGELRGVAFIGAGSHVGSGAVVEDAVIGQNVVVESGAVVKNSVIMGDCRIQRDAQVLDSILGSEVDIGAQAKLLDYSVIGAGTLIEDGDLLDGVRRPQ